VIDLLTRAATALLVFLIRAYQSIHVAFFRGSCRFHPTCSHYALEAIQLHGPGRGTLLTAWRVLRCQPFCRGGFDPVPEPKRKHPEASGEHFDASDLYGQTTLSRT
jgi:putative membrane protein insertion efficiency factor